MVLNLSTQQGEAFRVMRYVCRWRCACAFRRTTSPCARTSEPTSGRADTVRPAAASSRGPAGARLLVVRLCSLYFCCPLRTAHLHLPCFWWSCAQCPSCTGAAVAEVLNDVQQVLGGERALQLLAEPLFQVSNATMPGGHICSVPVETRHAGFRLVWLGTPKQGAGS